MSETLKLVIQILKVVFSNPEILEQLQALLDTLFGGGVVMALPAGERGAYLMANAETESLCRQIAGKLNINWERIMELFVKYILPFILTLEPKPEA